MLSPSIASAAAPPAPVAPPPTIAPDYSALPLLSQLEPAIRQQIPPYRLNIHVYSDQPAARLAYINNRLYREGDRTVEGGEVVAITDDSVVIEQQQQRFRLTL